MMGKGLLRCTGARLAPSPLEHTRGRLCGGLRARRAAPRKSQESSPERHYLARALDASQLAATLLGRDDTTTADRLGTEDGTITNNRAAVITLGIIPGSTEASTGAHTWRNSTDEIRRYFGYLTGQWIRPQPCRSDRGRDPKRTAGDAADHRSLKRPHQSSRLPSRPRQTTIQRRQSMRNDATDHSLSR